jgi:transposase
MCSPRKNKNVTCGVLQGCSGYLQVDCWAHARRKFTEADIAQGKGKSGKAKLAVNFIYKPYRIEIKIKDVNPEEKYDYRQEHAKPLLNDLHSWLTKSAEQVLPKTALGKALADVKNKNRVADMVSIFYISAKAGTTRP